MFGEHEGELSLKLKFCVKVCIFFLFLIVCNLNIQLTDVFVLQPQIQ